MPKNSKKPVSVKHNTQDLKRKLRASPEWRQFRVDLEDYYNGIDPLTLKPLRKGWNAHHCDMSLEHYSNLDFDNFRPLNKSSHDLVHALFRYYPKDPGILDRLKSILDLMCELNK